MLKALKLWWKKVQFIQHPRYNNPAYREEASVRDNKLQCCQASAFQVEGSNSGLASKDRSERGHCFTWRDAKWPWC